VAPVTPKHIGIIGIYVRFGSEADIPWRQYSVRFTQKRTSLGAVAMSAACQRRTLRHTSIQEECHDGP
jgi:hypothetical protein